jgi:hypothetical protein
MDAPHVWRFGYGSNIGLVTLREKKSLNPSQFLVGTIAGWDLAWKSGRLAHVEPAYAGVRQAAGAQLHGSAFCITAEEASGLDRQERGYNVVPCRFVAYGGEVVEEVGLYVPKTPIGAESHQPTPSLRYLRLMQRGAIEGGLAQGWIDRLMAQAHYVTPPEVRTQTEQWIAEFDADPLRKSLLWTAEELAGHDGSADSRLAHTSVMGYVVQIHPGCRTFGAWKGNDITRRFLLHFNGASMDVNDRRFGQDGFRPLPQLTSCSGEEVEFLFQMLESLLHQKCTIVARLQCFLEDQGDEAGVH